MPHSSRQLIAFLLIALAIAGGLAPVIAAPGLLNANTPASKERDRLIAEILKLDTKLALLQSEKAAAEDRLDELRAALKEAQHEKSRLLETAAEERLVVGRWLRFLVEEGSYTYLDVLLGAANLADFLNRLDIIITIVEANVNSLKRLQLLALEVEAQEQEYRAQEQEISLVYRAINRSLEEAKQLRQAKSQALAEAERKHDDFPAILALSQAWERVLPDVEHCLDRLSKTPWHTVQPDQVKLDYFRGRAEIALKERTLENLLNQGLSPQDQFQLKCRPPLMILSRPALDYSISFTISNEDRRLLFVPHSVTVGQTKIPDGAVHLLFQDRDLALNLPLIAGLQIDRAEIRSGEMRVFLKRGS